MLKLPENKRIPDIENQILNFWKENKIFEKSVSERPEKNLYVFYDGPPFISGLPHYGHLLSSIAKDVIPRYWTMKGKRVERVWGWDAHGLTVENRVQKKLGIKKRRDIEDYGLEDFIKECYIYTSETSAEWDWYIDKIARWVDMKNAYKTTDQDYMESVIWAFKELYQKGLIYEGVRTSLFCTTCGTPVSNFEIAMDNTYKDKEDPSITVKFKVTTTGKFKDAFILAWTTTPWTIPSNRGLVIDPKEEYVLVEYKGEKYVLAKQRLEIVFAQKDHQILDTFYGKSLIGLEYRAPYDFYQANENDFKIYQFEGMVSMVEGTGVVHSAPGFGEIDTEMGYHYGLTIMLTVDDEGNLMPGDKKENKFAGLFYQDANPIISRDLEKNNLLFNNDKIVHRYPFHDRCGTWLIQKAQNSWFINVQDLKDKMLKNNEEINWVPDHLKYGRFKHVIETSPDWCISRARFWATPMPVWRAEDGETIVVGSISELENLSGEKVEDLHRPFIDRIVIKKDGKEFHRIPEVLDSWFEAGSMPYGQLHYPFENQEKFEKNFPGDYITEYIAQVRAWFNMMHRLSTALFNSNSFKNVVTTGVLAGDDGRKMSKTYENYTDPKEVLENVGGDSLRLYMMNSPLMQGGNANFDYTELKNKLRNVINPLWNSLKFFLIYGVHHQFVVPDKIEQPKTGNLLDQWILTRLHETIRDFSLNIEAYLIPQAVQPIEDFVDDLSRWYVRRSRERISGNESGALDTLYYVLYQFSKAAAPIIPFISEMLYQQLKNDQSKESVHLDFYPDYDEKLISKNKSLMEKMKKTRDYVSAALAVRMSKQVPVRQPLKTAYITKENKLDEQYLEIIKDETNIKEIKFVDSLDKYDEVTKDSEGLISVDLKITEDLKMEGAARDMTRKFQSLRKKQKLNLEDKITGYFPDNEENNKIIKEFGSEIKEKILAEKLLPGEEYKIVKI